LVFAAVAVSGAGAQPPEGGGAGGVPFAPGVAVVPFANVSEISADDWIGAGIADAIAAGVAQGGLRVVESLSPAAAGAWAALVRPGDADRLALEAGRRAGAGI
jgi:TolB-like protein